MRRPRFLSQGILASFKLVKSKQSTASSRAEVVLHCMLTSVHIHVVVGILT